MSTKYPGGIISKTAPVPSGPYADSTAPGIWTLEQQAYWQKLGQWPTQGNASPSAFIENLFSTYLYTGTGAAQTITNGINVSGNGGLVWVKARGNGNRSHTLFDSATYTTGQYYLATNIPNALLDTGTPGMFGLTTSGFSVQSTSAQWNASGEAFSSWTFRKQAKFFDIQTFTSSAGGNKTFNHNLGSVPGCVFIKNTQTSDPWLVYHRSVGDNNYLLLNTTDASAPQSGAFSATSTTFTISSFLMYNSQDYVAYLFAHDAGGFGLSGSENVVSCGSFTTDGSGLFSVTLGYEPQWVMVKRSSGVGDWIMFDTMRGMPTAAASGVFSATLLANSAAIEDAAGGTVGVNATGFNSLNGYLASSSTFIYVAIRKGPMAVPTVGTNVFVPYAYAGSGAGTYTTGINQDIFFAKSKGSTYVWNWYDRLRGPNLRLQSNATSAESSTTGVTAFDNTSMTFGASDGFSSASPWGGPYIGYALTRAPSFFDEVCYTGTGTAGQTYTHNLAAVPELMIIKGRSNVNNWRVYSSFTGATKYLNLNSVDSEQTLSSMWNDTAPTASVFTVGTNSGVNTSATTYVAYLFATCAGVSKVGTYTGTGTLTTINCGFTGGARFVLIKKSSGVGSWFVWDTARGMVSGTDPSLRLNVTDAEQSGDSIYSIATGFQLLASPFENVNTNGDTYIFLAIA